MLCPYLCTSKPVFLTLDNCGLSLSCFLSIHHYMPHSQKFIPQLSIALIVTSIIESIHLWTESIIPSSNHRVRGPRLCSKICRNMLGASPATSAERSRTSVWNLSGVAFKVFSGVAEFVKGWYGGFLSHFWVALNESKWSILMGFSMINHPAIGVPPFLETPRLE